ncbi:MAG: hypothetical protein KA533_04950 [Sphingobium sp.]|nr:hypothetical protein [Sphingobium sp.]MBP6112909.1 hypothetical protein [Sphingobium sp.]MBP8672413.1 hypothetical protein [Sphingobium sp.]MBP9156289.1 hypothetical protein [Sphingobium sp.]MCC6482579.1 hypothetical protein [Sphingomonadaceae bacterium]
MTIEIDDTLPEAQDETTAEKSSGWTKPALIGLGGAVASAAIAAAVIYAGRSRRKNVDKLAAAERTPPTD